MLAANDEGETMDEFLDKLRNLLGLGESATSAEILSAVNELLHGSASADDGDESAHSHAPDPARYVGIAEFQQALTELNALKAERSHERSSHAVDEAIRTGKLIPAQREWALSYCSADARGFQAFIARQPSIVASGSAFAAESPARIASARPQISSVEIAICGQLGVSETDFQKRKAGRADFLRFERSSAENDR
jgi:phage I-like protein